LTLPKTWESWLPQMTPGRAEEIKVVMVGKNFEEDLPIGYIPLDSVHSPIKRVNYSVEAARLGADYVDVEFSAFWQAVLEAVPRQRVILSYHNFEETPADLEAW
jgi:DNA-directed RNA polymerase subunit alpha